MKLILPTKKYLGKVEEYKKKLIEGGSSMDGCGSLKTDDATTWLKKCNDHRREKNLPEGYVPATQYICVRKCDDKILGMLQIRHYLTNFLLNYGGHIGYCIAFDERNKGYGKKMLALGLKKCKLMGLKRVLITCKDTNAPSRKCILANGGVYEDSRYLESEGVTIERYWIDLN